MMMYKLEKDISLYKNQFEDLVLNIFQRHLMERLSMDLDGLLFRIKYMVKNDKDLTKLPEMKNQFISKALELRSIFGEIMYNFLVELVGFGDNFSKDDIEDLMAQDVKMDNVHVRFKMLLLSENKNYLDYVDASIEDGKVFNMFPDKFFRYYVDSYNDGIAKAYPELFESRQQDSIGTGHDSEVFVHSMTLQTTEDCNLNCFPAGTKILMEDFSHKNIEDIELGDTVLGFEEFNEFQHQRSLISTIVTQLFHHDESCYKISHPSFKEDLYVTPEHPMLTARGDWIHVRDLRPSDGLLMTTFDPDDYYHTNVDHINYVKGYFIAGWLGDGCVMKRTQKDGYRRYFMRFVVKDIDMTERMKRFSETLGFNFTTNTFKMSHKDGCYRDTLYSGKRDEYERWVKLCEETFSDKQALKDPDFLMGFMAGFYDAEGGIWGACIRIHNSDNKLLRIVEAGLNFLKIKWDYDKPHQPANKIVYTLRILGGSPDVLKFLKSTRPAIKRKGSVNLVGKSLFQRIDGYTIEYAKYAKTVYNFETTEHTYIANRLLVHNCSYCYMFNKSDMRMTFDIAKKFIDELLADRYGYINRYNSPALILEFIGGEPLLEITLTRKIYEYFLDRTYELEHPWFNLHRLSICSNGLQYFDEEVQSFFRDYAGSISFNISIDGNKELHDSCRIQPSGEGSYDIDMIALNHFNRHHTPERNSKMTLAPDNMRYLFDSVKSFIENGMMTINLNCIFEEGWNQETALLEYNELKKVADYILENDLENLYIAIFNERQEDTSEKSYDGNFCFKDGTQVLAIDGHRNIEDLNINTLLYTASGSIHKIVNISQRKSRSNMKIHTSGTFPIECTRDHKIFARKMIQEKGETYYEKPEFYEASELVEGDSIALPILDLSQNKKNWINNNIAYALGVYLLCGTISMNRIVVPVDPDNKVDVREHFQRAGLNITTDRPDRVEIYRQKSELNDNFFKLCLRAGIRPNVKSVPQILFESKKDIIQAMINGYFQAGGFQVAEGKNHEGLLKISIISRHLANDLLILLRSVNQYPICTMSQKPITIDVDGSKMSFDESYGISYNPINSYLKDHYEIDQDHYVAWVGIRSIAFVNDEWEVFCPTVMPINEGEKEEHTIIANNAAVNQCFRGDMQVLTINGSKNIRDLHVGELLYTASGSIHKVTRMTKRFNESNRKVTAAGIFPIHCTDDHKVFAKKFLYMGWKGVLHYSDPGFYPISELKKGDRMALPILQLPEKQVEKWLTEELAYAFGVYLADGHGYTDSIVITPGYDDDKSYMNMLRGSGLTISVSEMRTSMRYDIHKNSSEANRKFIELCLMSGVTSWTKHIPETIFNSPKNIVQKVLDGYLETDGWQVPEDKHIAGMIKVNTVSQHLASDILVLLRAVGEYPTCYLNNRAGTMIIEGRTVNVRDRYEIYYNPTRPNGNNMFKNDDQYSLMWTGIRDIQNDENYDVYCPTVSPLTNDLKEEHSIIVNGLGAQNCGGTGAMLSLRPNGQFYPCIRYMPSSVGDNVDDLCIGTVQDGMVGREENSEVLKLLDSVTRRSQSNDICYKCPIGNDCAHCSAMSQTVYGTPNKKGSFICIQMIAEALANVYYWNRLLIHKPHYDLPVRKNNVPDEWSLLVVDEVELENLKLLECMAMIKKIEYSGT